MSNELKRTFLAGALIAGLLLVAQMFGVFGVPEEGVVDSPANDSAPLLVDCAGVKGGSAVEDCAGICGGGANEDECGVCDGPGAIYECGCNGPEENADCDGNCLEGIEEDACGVCGGDGKEYVCEDGSKACSSSKCSVESSAIEISVIDITNGWVDLSLSSFAGGSIIDYKLTKKDGEGSFVYSGVWKDSLLYDRDAAVDLILNKEDFGCAPCVVVYEGDKKEVLNVPFSVVDNSFSDGAITTTKSFNFELKKENYTVIKTVSIDPNSFITKHSVRVLNNENSFETRVGLVWDKGIRNTETDVGDDIAQYIGSYAGIDNTYETFEYDIDKDGDSVSFSGPVDWASMRNKYFTLAFVGSEGSVFDGALLSSSPYSSLFNGVKVPVFKAEVYKKSETFEASLYLGPLDKDQLAPLSYLTKTMNFGYWIISPFAQGILWGLKSLGPSGLGLHYGFVLILFAFIVRLITGPLTKRSHKSTQAMQKIQPDMKKLQEKYKKEPQKLNQEMVKLYKEKGVNPLGGCLPMLIQMPLLFGLFIVFRSTIELRGVSFLWISDLANPDVITPVVVNNFLDSIPGISFFYGHGIALLPIVVGTTMILSQRLNAATMDKKQKPMMLIMSIFFFLLFNKFSAGLNLYYAVYNILNYIQQRSLKKQA